MIIWLDAQLSPSLARWIRKNFNVQAHHVRDIGGLLNATDLEIFEAARQAGAVLMTKDADFKSSARST